MQVVYSNYLVYKFVSFGYEIERPGHTSLAQRHKSWNPACSLTVHGDGGEFSIIDDEVNLEEIRGSAFGRRP